MRIDVITGLVGPGSGVGGVWQDAEAQAQAFHDGGYVRLSTVCPSVSMWNPERRVETLVQRYTAFAQFSFAPLDTVSRGR